ncbi:MAG: hypothetical protein HFI87_02065 [Bacilli bacterium]|nr:hypothetical protein [Bacilli bacterium]
MNTSIEIDYSKGKIYIPDVSVYDSVSVKIASNEPFDKKHYLKLKKFIRNHDILDDDVSYYEFDYEKKEDCLKYYEKIKEILKKKVEEKNAN